MIRRKHRMPFGAEAGEGNSGRFRLWAPAARQVDLCLECGCDGRVEPMERSEGGWFEVTAECGAGSRYRFRIDSGPRVPDPASRFQPEDVHGPSEVIDPHSFLWTDDGWHGRSWEEAVIYELHVGTFTAEGTFAAAAERLTHLCDLGVTAIELMPVADAPGRRNWGYDGVYPFAPESAHGRPEDLKAFVNAAHRLGMMVLLDVVYNHFGPEGNYLQIYAPSFFTGRHQTPWGAGINFDGGERPVRDFFIHNALFWLTEYHMDGLRLDAAHAIRDDSDPHILTELAEVVRTQLDTDRQVHLVLENDRNEPGYLERRADGAVRGYDAQWNDDVHHALHILLTGEKGGYYADYSDAPVRHLGRALTEGFAYQGERSRHRGGTVRGAPSGHLPPTAFVSFLQNHDQIGNRAFGERLTTLAAAEAIRAAMTVLLLAPSPPLLFMGEEWGALQPFPFFCDFGPELARAVREGRLREFSRFPEFRDPAMRARIPEPSAESTFRNAVLDWSVLDADRHREWLTFYRTLLTIRRTRIVPRLTGIGGHAGRFQTRPPTGLNAEWRLGSDERLILRANLGAAALEAAPEETPGGLVYATNDSFVTESAAGRRPPWSAAWFLVPGTGDAHDR